MTNKELAKSYYLDTDLSQKQIAQKLGITQATLSKWVNESNWKKLKKSDDIARNICQKLLTEIDAILSRDMANDGDADKISKYTAAYQRMKGKQLAITDYISVFTKFGDWLHSEMPNNLELLKTLVRLQDKFLKTVNV